MACRVTEIKRSLLFEKLWLKYSANVNDKEVTLEIIFTEIWLKIREKLKLIHRQFLNGEIQVNKIDKYLRLFEMDYDAFEKEFMLLSRFFQHTVSLEQAKKIVSDRMAEVKSYKKLSAAHQAARVILELQQKMDLKGDFSEVEKIEKVIFKFYNYFSELYCDAKLCYLFIDNLENIHK